jgi:hypothetical protein
MKKFDSILELVTEYFNTDRVFSYKGGLWELYWDFSEETEEKYLTVIRYRGQKSEEVLAEAKLPESEVNTPEKLVHLMESLRYSTKNKEILV